MLHERDTSRYTTQAPPPVKYFHFFSPIRTHYGLMASVPMVRCLAYARNTSRLTPWDTAGMFTLVMSTQSPTLGALVTVRGIQCRIVAIHPFGTLDVVSLDGQHAFRITGLLFN